nr:immunoglobulin light chain junction region [Mus musculus]NSL99761.1 immunoglobulin light chain junction region [Mus musculus]NSM01043.1 immunoglobulin light chain junction region [Mus musculus]NSM01161.1 immunoglobulin light chain junction region [Mus musculus]
CQQSNEGPRTF